MTNVCQDMRPDSRSYDVPCRINRTCASAMRVRLGPSVGLKWYAIAPAAHWWGKKTDTESECNGTGVDFCELILAAADDIDDAW